MCIRDRLNVTQKNFKHIEIPFEMDGIDLRNYGNPEGIPSARTLGAQILSTEFDETIALDNSSLTIMQQLVSCAYHLGFPKSKLSKKTKFTAKTYTSKVHLRYYPTSKNITIKIRKVTIKFF